MVAIAVVLFIDGAPLSSSLVRIDVDITVSQIVCSGDPEFSLDVFLPAYCLGAIDGWLPGTEMPRDVSNKNDYFSRHYHTIAMV
jgi:hypothetical protein